MWFGRSESRSASSHTHQIKAEKTRQKIDNRLRNTKHYLFSRGHDDRPYGVWGALH